MVRRSQLWRRSNSETDALLLGMGWTPDDLGKPQVLIESAFGQSHPGSAHLLDVAQAVAEGVTEAGGKAALYHVTDMCDGVAQGQPGMGLSLFSRDVMAAMLWVHGQCHPADAAVFVASCDKSLPAHLLALARLDLPSLVVPGGVMLAGGACRGVDALWALDADVQSKGDEHRVDLARRSACPTCGACQYMGTAGTMQVVAEALGLALPGSALCPAAYVDLKRLAREAGRTVVHLLKRRINPRAILTPEAFHNALVCHAAVGGSPNAVLHLQALGRAAGVDLDIEWFDRVSRRIPVIANVHNVGRFPSPYLWFAGGVPALMGELENELHLDCLTVTGKSAGENLRELEASGFFAYTRSYLETLGVHWRQVIAPFHAPVFAQGGLAVLKGNLCPGGAVVKLHGIPRERWEFVGPARVFTAEDVAIEAVRQGMIAPGSAIVLNFQGVRARGMPELFRIVDALNHSGSLGDNCIVITDGRFSGATRGPAVGYVSPEAAAGGPIAAVQDGDLVRLDVAGRRLDLVAADGTPLDVLQMSSRRASVAVPSDQPFSPPDPLWTLYRGAVWWERSPPRGE